MTESKLKADNLNLELNLLRKTTNNELTSLSNQLNHLKLDYSQTIKQLHSQQVTIQNLIEERKNAFKTLDDTQIEFDQRVCNYQSKLKQSTIDLNQFQTELKQTKEELNRFKHMV